MIVVILIVSCNFTLQYYLLSVLTLTYIAVYNSDSITTWNESSCTRPLSYVVYGTDLWYICADDFGFVLTSYAAGLLTNYTMPIYSTCIRV
jgi:hypothetical protein